MSFQIRVKKQGKNLPGRTKTKSMEWIKIFPGEECCVTNCRSKPCVHLSKSLESMNIKQMSCLELLESLAVPDCDNLLRTREEMMRDPYYYYYYAKTDLRNMS
jgi:hypothetical protein